MARRGTSRDRILRAASELAFKEGAAHLSLDAVAARAGVSKGGLLYNFPNKVALMRALVQQYLDEFGAELESAGEKGGGERLAARYLEVAMEHLEERTRASSGLLAALAEDPELLAPVKRFNRQLVDRMKSGSADAGAVLILFLVLEGLRAQRVFGTEILDEDEQRIVLERTVSLMAANGPSP